MFRKFKFVLCTVLSLTLIIPYLSVAGKAMLFSETSEISDITSEGISEEKNTCTATLDDKFDDGSVIVSLTKDTNLELRKLTQSDFPEIKIKNIKSLTEAFEPLVKKAREIKKVEMLSVEENGLSINDASSYIGNIDTSEEFFKRFSIQEILEIEQDFNQIIRIDLEEKGKQNVLDAIKVLEKRDDVVNVEPNYIYTICKTPNDADFDEQWAADAMDLEKAWDITTGSTEVLVGIVDTGIDSTHLDLAGNLELPLSKDFTEKNNIGEDLDGHGTHVAGIVGAVGNNNRNVAGVCWNVKLVNLRVFSDQRNEEGKLITDTDTIIQAVKHADQQRIPILNLSIAGEDNSNELKKAINDFEGIVICAAGNEGLTENKNNDNAEYPCYPASFNCDNIISVAASDWSESLAVFSSYGKTTVDLAAPGNSILSTYPNNSMETLGGTSMATPQVTGVAALLKSKYPSITTAQIKSAILDNVDTFSHLTEKCVTGGRLNANKALRYKDKYFTVKYNANGGSGTMLNTKVYYGVTENLRENEFTRSGYEFACWYAKRSSDNKWRYESADGSSRGWYLEGQQPEGWVKYGYVGGQEVSALSSVAKDTVTLYARWKKYFVVKYDANGGNGYMYPQQVFNGEETGTMYCEFSRSGYTFDGWYAKRQTDNKWRYQNASGTSREWYLEGEQPEGWVKYKYRDGAPVSSLTESPGGVVTFYAQWKKYFIVEYDANGGNGGVAYTIVYYDVPTTLELNSSYRDGYDFSCWYAKREKDNKWRYESADGTSRGWYEEGQQPEGWVKYGYPDGAIVSALTDVAGGVVTFYAQWKKYFYVEYHSNAGDATGEMPSHKVIYGDSTRLSSNIFTRVGYDFDGWFARRGSDNKWRYRSDSDSTGDWYIEGEEPSGWYKFRYANRSIISKTEGKAGHTAHFYAQWKKYFIVKYDANGGTGTMNDTKVYYGVYTPLRTNTFTKEGNEFDCWYAKREADNKWRYESADGSSRGWYEEGQQPEGWVKYGYADCQEVSALTSTAGGQVTFYAQWK